MSSDAKRLTLCAVGDNQRKLPKLSAHVALGMAQTFTNFSADYRLKEAARRPIQNESGHFVDTFAFSNEKQAEGRAAQKHESRAVRGFEYGGPSRTRTYDQRIMSPLL